ncbi:MAG: hypothetical protein R3F30_04130 [Planctomycetota bacterium]
MRKLLTALSLSALLGLGSCMAGPHQLRRTVDDWDAKMYTESPWLDAVLWIVPVIPLANFGATIADFFVSDGYTFWVKDAFKGEGGTGFKHAEYLGKQHVKSLLLDDAEFLNASGS